MFGPVTMASRAAAPPEPSSRQSLGVKGSPARRTAASTTGWRAASASNTTDRSTSGRVACTSSAHSARAAETSSTAIASAADWISPARPRACSRQASKVSSSMARARSPAWAIFASSSASSTVVKRTWLARVWRWMKTAFSGAWNRGSACLAVASTK